MTCPKCQAVSLNEEVCSACGVIFSKFDQSVTEEKVRQRQKEFDALTGDFIPASIEPWLPLIAWPVTSLLLWMMPMIAWMMAMWPHEFGHAFVGWFGGIAATPIPFAGFTSYGGERSWFVTICFTTLLGLLSYKAWKGKSYFLILTFVCMFIAQIVYRSMHEEELRKWQAYGGIGGEFWISAWFIMAYHYRFPEKTYWHVLRPIFLLMGSVTFFHNLYLWIGVSRGTKDIPWGSLWGGHGDMNQLVDDWYWSRSMITDSYLKLGYFCLAILIIHYLGQIVYRLWVKPVQSRA